MEIIKISEAGEEEIISIACNALKQGKVLILPTDTVYGLVVDATNPKAVEKVFEIKKRDRNKALSIFVKDVEEIERLSFVDKEQSDFLRNNLPGELTVILKRKTSSDLAENLFGKNTTIGLRVVNCKIINDILEKLGRPITATSANVSGQPSSIKIREILEQFEKEELKPDLVFDIGNLPENQPSVIIDLTGKEFKIIREGVAKL